MGALHEPQQRHVSVLVNDIAQAVELIASLDIVGPPCALKKFHILVELIVLAGVKRSVCVVIGLSGKSSRLLQTHGQRITEKVSCAVSVCAPLKIGCRGLPSKVMIILEKISKTRSGYDILRQGNIGPDVVC